ncbi:MAG: hypothetical protein JO185_13485 [Acidobacteriaceae bacterium]|nr:hypothetical protein [Acidobacteriaceae bacterium]
MRPVPTLRRSRHSVALPVGPCGQLRRFTLQVRLRGELGVACEVDCTGLEDALRFGQSQFRFFTERNPWIGLDWLQRKIWILLDPETESLSHKPH